MSNRFRWRFSSKIVFLDIDAMNVLQRRAPLMFEKHILEEGDQISRKLHLLSVQSFPEWQEGIAAVFIG